MSVFNYKKFKISIDENSRKTQGLHVGDIVRRQYFDYPNVIYSLICVVETGVDTVTVEENGKPVKKRKQWFVGILLDGDEPKSNEILDFVRVTNLWDANRLGALYLTASDEQAPYLDVIDGIAREKSLCFPTGINNVSWEDGFSQYTVIGKRYVSSEYLDSCMDNYRVCKITKNSTPVDSNTFIGLSQLIDKELENPNRAIISYKIKSSRNMNNLVATLEYQDGTRVDGTVNVESTTEWMYKVHMITLDYSGRYKRKFTLNINDNLQENDFVEIADFNIVLLADIGNFADGMKVRIGKMSGITDPVFGELEDYGVYAQRFYATKQVNISGTLTAGDENGFGCTFYAGKIHKNAVINSIACDFETQTEIVPTADSPVGVGEVYSSSSEIVLNAQTNSWMLGKRGKQYTFSLWIKSSTQCDILISQNEYSVKVVRIIGDDTWRRYSASFTIREAVKAGEKLQMRITPSAGKIYITAPQLESGVYSTQYQPTDDVLAYIEDYGAWFSKGGIGGTIQNPLLKLNDDGSISSKNKSFVIKNDGSGYFANGRFKWTEKEITLQGVTIKWEDLDDTAKDELKPKSIKLLGNTTFVVDRGNYDPSSITVEMKETNFISSSSQRCWYYLGADNMFVLIDGYNGRTFTVYPDSSYWNGNTLTLKCTCVVNSIECSDTITIQKIENGEDSYSVLIRTSSGTTFKNGVGSTTLTAHVYRGGDEITGLLANKDFDWIKTSEDVNSDNIFNNAHLGFGNKLTITSDDVWNMAQFDCRVRINF